MDNRIANIKQLEAAHNRLENTITNFEKLLDEWESLLPEYKKLIRYYESPQWQKDYEYSNSADSPKMWRVVSWQRTHFTIFSACKGVWLFEC